MTLSFHNSGAKTAVFQVRSGSILQPPRSYTVSPDGLLTPAEVIDNEVDIDAGLTCNNSTCTVGGTEVDAATAIDGAVDDATTVHVPMDRC